MLRDYLGKGMYHCLLEWYVVMQFGLFAQAPVECRHVQFSKNGAVIIGTQVWLFVKLIVPLNVQY